VTLTRPFALLVACALAGCRAREVGPYTSASVVLVSIDTLRADRLALYGYDKGSTPALDALGRESVVFEQAYSHCPLTLPAHASMLTGLLPPRHGVRDNSGFSLDPAHRTLAARFRAAGLSTGAAVSAYVLRAATGIAQGFDAFDDALEVEAGSDSLSDQQRDGGAAVESLSRWVDAQGARRFFAFLHLYEPHAPYAPPERHSRFANPYDGEVAYADELVGRFVAHLRSRGLLERLVLLVTSDHGEGLLDHGEQEHGIFLYREALRVPLLVRLPAAARAGSRVAAPVGQADVAATLLDLVGLPAGGMDGVSLRRALATGTHEPRPVYSETLFPRYHFGWSELFAATDARWRFIRAPRSELFDAASDPGEKSNLAPQRPSVVASMNAFLDRHVAAGATPPGAVSPQVRRRLEALGYLGSGAARTAPGMRADPKDKIGVHESYKRAFALRGAGKNTEALSELRRLLAEDPGMLDAWEALGLILARMDQPEEAVSALDKVIEGDPERASAHLALARLHAIHGRRERAEKHAELASGADPGGAYETLAELMLERNRLAEAAAYARRSLAADPARVMSHFVLATAARREGRCEEAVSAYRAAAEAQQRQKGLLVRSLRAGMADCLARLGREAEAEKEFLAEIEAIPHSREGRVGLAMLYRSQARDAEARAVLEGVVTAHPRAGADEYWTVIRTFTVLGDAAAAREWARRARARFGADRRFRSAAP
jgi:arylsulfatase A-like enzyme/tetratricopeptide (TPR) repeat protein